MTKEILHIIAEWKQGRYNRTLCWSGEDVEQVILDKKAFILSRVEPFMPVSLGVSIFLISTGLIFGPGMPAGSFGVLSVFNIIFLAIFFNYLGMWNREFLCVGPRGIFWKIGRSLPHFIPWNIVHHVTKGTRRSHHVVVPEVNIELVTESILTFDYRWWSHAEIKRFPAFFALFEGYNAASVHQQKVN